MTLKLKGLIFNLLVEYISKLQQANSIFCVLKCKFVLIGILFLNLIHFSCCRENKNNLQRIEIYIFSTRTFYFWDEKVSILCLYHTVKQSLNMRFSSYVNSVFYSIFGNLDLLRNSTDTMIHDYLFKNCLAHSNLIHPCQMQLKRKLVLVRVCKRKLCQFWQQKIFKNKMSY